MMIGTHPSHDHRVHKEAVPHLDSSHRGKGKGRGRGNLIHISKDLQEEEEEEEEEELPAMWVSQEKTYTHT